MSRWTKVGQGAGLLGAAAGVVVAGAGVGLATERYVVNRALRRRDAPADTSLGELHSPARRVVADDGVELHVEVDEPVDRAARGRPTVVFCHGYALSLDSWHYQRLGLRGSARLVFWDQRSHGRSARAPSSSVTIDQLGRDLGSVIDSIVPTGRVVLVGHSMGGMTTMALADARPDLFGSRVSGLALISTSAGKLSEVTLGIPARAAPMLHRLAPGVVDALGRRAWLVEQSRRVGRDLAYVVTKRYAFASDVPASLVRFTEKMLAATPIDVVADFFPAFASHDKLAALAVLNHVETLIVVGENDLLTPAAHGKSIAAAVPDAALLVLEPCGHMSLLEHPEAITDALRGLIERAAARTPGRRRARRVVP